MKNEQNKNQEGRVVQIKNKPNTQNSFYKDIFSFKKRFDINKFEKLDIENKSVIEEKLKQIKELQEQMLSISLQI